MKKKIGIISVLALCTLLVAAIITLSAVKVNNLPNLGNPDWIMIYSSASSSERVLTKGQEKYDEFVETFNDCFTEQLISALFSGRIKGDYDVNADGNVSPTKPYVKYKFDNAQTLTIKGETIYDPSNTTKEVTYNEVYFNVSENNEKKDVKIYLRNSSSKSVYSFIVYVNLYDVFEFIAEC